MDDIGLGKSLVDILQSEADNIIKVHSGNKYIKGIGLEYTINPSRASDYESLYRSLRRLKIIPQKIIQLWNISDLVSESKFFGKAGTNNDKTEAWFVGCGQRITTAVWFGFDRPKRLYGSIRETVTPVWLKYIRILH